MRDLIVAESDAGICYRSNFLSFTLDILLVGG
jgi:hypothetical protein